jgi:hypothetical protein
MADQFPEVTVDSDRIEEIETILSGFDPVSLKELSTLTFQIRNDKKFLFHIETLPKLLNLLSAHYFRILEIEGKRIHTYHTLYFDTPDYRMYLDHHNDKLNRYKIRLRKYATTGSSFLEVKLKNNKNQTLKNRAHFHENDILQNRKELFFIEHHSPYKFSCLQESIKNSFLRMTFTDKQMTQRLTIDIGLTFVGFGKEKGIQTLVIAELKQNSQRSAGLVFQILHNLKIYPHRFSKYCIGQSILNNSVKHNRFLPQMQMINKICRCELINRDTLSGTDKA